MKRRLNNSSPEIFAEISQFKKVNVDRNKIDLQRKGSVLAIQNYVLFQKYSCFRWPAWLHNSPVAETPDFRPISPPFLANNAIREGIFFTNLFSDAGIFVDPSGAVSPSYDYWSAEVWIVDGGSVFRPSENLASVDIRRDASGGEVTATWTQGHHEVVMTIIGARQESDEAVIHIRTYCKTKPNDSTLMVSFRPYNNNRIGTITAIAFRKDGAVAINGKVRAMLLEKPDAIFTGNGKNGDIDPAGDARASSVECDSGMAALSCRYPLKKGENQIHLRISLDRLKELKPAKTNFADLKKGFCDFLRLRAGSGCRLAVSDARFENWFFGSKQSLLCMTAAGMTSSGTEDDPVNYRTLFYMVLAASRMGYFEEGIRIAEAAIEGAAARVEKSASFADAVSIGYALAGFADLYSHTRNMDLLQGSHPVLKKISLALAEFTSTIKKPADLGCNSLDYNFTMEGHAHDLALFSSALGRFAYLSRCIGIFGDEAKFEKEADRMGAVFRAAMQSGISGPLDDFFSYNCSSVFPFGLKAVDGGAGAGFCDRILALYNGAPVVVKSLGLDLLATLLTMNCMLYQKRSQVWDVLDRVFLLGGNRLSLPDFANPSSSHGCLGQGASLAVCSMLFCTMRNLLYIDTRDRLELFPVPKEDWFMPGSELRIQDMPSRFGGLNIRVVSTANEIQLQFENLPKYVPPDIMINLPCNASVVKEDDFVLKKEFGSSFLINGWPALIRFVRT